MDRPRIRILTGLFFGVAWLLAQQAAAQFPFAATRLALPKPFYKASIQKIGFDEDGFLWFTTYQGLWRYDGTMVQPFDFTPYGINFSIARTDFTCYDHRLVLMQGNNLYIIDPVARTMVSQPLKSSQGSLSIDASGRLFFLDREGEAFTWCRKEGFRRSYPYLEKQSPQANGFESYFLDTLYRKLYVFTGDSIGLAENNSVRWRPMGLANKSDSLISPMEVLVTRSLLLLRYNNGFALFDRRSMALLREYHGLGVSVMVSDRDRLVFFRQQTGFTRPMPADSLYDLKVPLSTEILRRRDVRPIPSSPGSYLLATDKGIFVWNNRNENSEPAALTWARAVMKGKSIRSICRAANGKYYLGTYDGLFVADSAGCRKINTTITYVLRPVANGFLVGGSEGGSGFLVIDTRTDSVRLFPSLPNKTYVYSMMPWRYGFLCGGGNELYYLSGHDSAWTYRLWKRFKPFSVVRSLCTWRGLTYIGTSTGLWTCDDAGRTKKIYPAEGTLMVNALLPTARGLWLGTQGKGVLLLDSSHHIVQEVGGLEGLPGLYVYSLAQSGTWITGGTDGGMLLMNESGELRSLPDDNAEDQLAGQEFNHSALWNDGQRHEMLAGGVSGLYCLEMPASEDAKDQRALHLSYIKKGNNKNLAVAADLFAGRLPVILMKPSDTYLAIKIATPVGQTPGALFFRLYGQSDDWQPLTADQEIHLFSLSPGRYKLQVRFGNQAAARGWLEQAIEVQPPWFGTLWFRLLMGLVLVGVGYALWREKLAKLRRDQQLRTAIASDLHDEIGSALTRISISSELLTLRPQGHNEEVLIRISTDSKKAIASISDIIWSIDARNDNGDDLVLRMREQVHYLLDPALYECSILVEGFEEKEALPQVLRQNLYLIFKEAVNNIARHTRRGRVEVLLRKDRQGITLLLRNELPVGDEKPSAPAGQGLRNIGMRARRMHGEAHCGRVGAWFEMRVALPPV